MAGNLSYGDVALLEMAIALATDPVLLLLDEPVAGMSHVETERMVAKIKALRKSVNIILVEHDMETVFNVAERITVMTNGAILTEGSPEQIAKDVRVQEAYLGSQEVPRYEMFAMNNVNAGYGKSQILHAVSLDVGDGEAVALLGRNGVGKTTTLRTIMGLTPVTHGTISI